MSNYTLSVVLLIPAAYRDEINALAEESGYGPDCITVPLVHTNGGEWFGSHSWAAPEFLTDMGASPPSAALAALVASARAYGTVDDEGDVLSTEPLAHWNETLIENGLSMVAPSEAVHP